MAYLQTGIQGAGAGAGVGMAIGGPVGAAIGAGAGFLAGLFGGEDPEDVSAERFREYLDFLSKEKKKEIAETMPAIAKMTSGMIQQGTAGATRRALAEGDVASKESYINPVVSRIARAGSQTMSSALSGINSKYSTAAINEGARYAERPIQPSAMDYLAEAAPTVAGMINFDKIIKKMPGGDPTLAGKILGGTNNGFNYPGAGDGNPYDASTMAYIDTIYGVDEPNPPIK